MQDPLSIDCEACGSDQMEGIDADVFELISDSEVRSVGYNLKKFREGSSINALGVKIFTLTGTKSLSTWKVHLTKFKKCDTERRNHYWMYSDANWRLFIDSDVAAPAYPPRERRPPETRHHQETDGCPLSAATLCEAPFALYNSIQDARRHRSHRRSGGTRACGPTRWVWQHLACARTSGPAVHRGTPAPAAPAAPAPASSIERNQN
jgi:hypothetical protein